MLRNVTADNRDFLVVLYSGNNFFISHSVQGETDPSEILEHDTCDKIFY